jgi:hypothetical protein
MGQVVGYTTSNSGPTWNKGEKLVKTPNQLVVMRQAQEDDMDSETEMDEYKDEYFEMSMASIKAIAAHANNILSALEDNNKKNTISENLTESWLQGKIAVTEENMRTIHDFVMFSEPETDIEDSESKVEPVDIKKKDIS